MSEQQEAIEKVLELKKAYNRVFKSDDGKIVFKDLEGACHAHTTTFDPNPYVAACQEGNRQVLTHIKSRMNLQNVLQLLKPNKGDTNA